MDDNSVVIKYLKSRGYNPQTSYYGNISYWEEWYENDVKKFHEYHDQDGVKREIYRLGMAKRGCEDWSSILYTEKDQMTCDNTKNQEYLNTELEKLKFEEIIPENIENGFWSGTLGTIVRVENAIKKGNVLTADDKTKLNLINVTADKIIPLKIVHGKIIDVAFVSKTTIESDNVYYIEIHELQENGYHIENIYINEKGEIVKNNNVIESYDTGSNVPLFSLLEPRIVNNIQNNNGLGISIYANATDQLKGCDLRNKRQ